MLGFLVSIATSIFGFAVKAGIPKILDRVLDVVDKRVSDEAERERIKNDLLQKYLEADVQESLVRKDAFGKWAWVMAACFLPGPVIWWNSTFLVSTFPDKFPGWIVLALPTDFYPWVGAIIGALFFVPVLNNFTKK